MVDLRSKLGLAHASRGRMPCIVVVGVRATGGERLAEFIADRVSGLVELRARDIRSGIARTKGRPRRLLDPDEILQKELEKSFLE